MGLLVGGAWVVVAWDLPGRSQLEDAAASGRAWLRDTQAAAGQRALDWLAGARDRARQRAHAWLDDAWTAAWAPVSRDQAEDKADRSSSPPRAGDTAGGPRPETDAADPADPAGRAPDSKARERVSRLDRARRQLPEDEPHRDAPPPPDRPASAAERRALDRVLAN